MADPPFAVRGLGEVALRCRDLDRMWAFYRDVVGLPVLREPGEAGIGFFRVADGYRGHTAVLALFRGTGDIVSGEGASLHHLALSVDVEAQEAIRAWMAARGVETRVERFGWVGWRGVFIRDPEGNTVEFVAADPALLDPPGG